MLHLPCYYMEQGRNMLDLSTEQVHIYKVNTDKNIALVLI